MRPGRRACKAGINERVIQLTGRQVLFSRSESNVPGLRPTRVLSCILQLVVPFWGSRPDKTLRAVAAAGIDKAGSSRSPRVILSARRPGGRPAGGSKPARHWHKQHAGEEKSEAVVVLGLRHRRPNKCMRKQIHEEAPRPGWRWRYGAREPDHDR